MATHGVYENLCAIGRQQQMQVTAEVNAVRDAVIKAQHLGAPFGAEQRVIDQRAQLEGVRIELSRHVAHCNDGCRRVADPETVFSGPAYERSPTHQKLTVPAAPELAQRVRDGESIEDLATQYERHPSTIIQRLQHAGFSNNGQPKRPTPDDDGALLLKKPFRYEPWMDDAVCAQTDPDSFFPDKGGSTREAKAVCTGCTVAAECLDYALQNNERFGIWGGLSERERRALTRPPTTDFPTDGNDIHHQETA
jgi:hypothetical protein